MPFSAAIAVLAGSLTLAAAADVPWLNVERYCGGKANNDSEIYKACLRAEWEARDRLAELWVTARPMTRADCGSRDDGGFLASYQEMLACMMRNYP